MKLLYIFLLLFSTFGYAQDHQGYYITNNDQRVEGYFKNTNYIDSQSLEFRSAITDHYIEIKPSDIKEYGIGDEYKLVKRTVEIDQSEAAFNRVGNSKDPIWKSETVFLNVLAEGDASLYSYNSGTGTKFFYSIKSKGVDINQLVFKVFMSTPGTTSENKQYIQQLFLNLSCAGQPWRDFQTIRYNKKELLEPIKNYNTCSGSSTKEYSNRIGRKFKFNFTIVAGAYSTTYGIKNARLPQDKSTEPTYGFGAELAMVLPSGKWELFLRGEYEFIAINNSSTHEQGFNTLTTHFNIDAKIINLYFGPRYNVFINNKSNLFIDVALGVSSPSGEIVHTDEFISNTGIEYSGERDVLPLKIAMHGDFGIGYIYREKYGIVLKYDTNRNIFANSGTGYDTHLTRIGLNLRYTF